MAQNIASKLDDLVDGMKNSSDDLRKEVITELKSVSKSIKDLDKNWAISQKLKVQTTII